MRITRGKTATVTHQCGWCGDITLHRCRELSRFIREGHTVEPKATITPKFSCHHCGRPVLVPENPYRNHTKCPWCDSLVSIPAVDRGARTIKNRGRGKQVNAT